MKPKQFFYVALGLFVVLAVGGGYGYYLGLTYVHQKSDALAEKLAAQTAADQQIDDIEKLQHQYNRDITPIIPLIDAALPRAKKQTEILAQIQRIAQSVGLQITGVTMPNPAGLPSEVSQTIQAGTVLALPINFKVSGTYPKLQAFTSQIESLNRYTNVTTLAISRPDNSGNPEYSFSLNAYIKP